MWNYNQNTTQLNPFLDASMEAQVDIKERQANIRRNLVVWDKLDFFVRYYTAQSERTLHDFAMNLMARRMFATSCDQAASAAVEITAACAAYRAEANSINHTIEVLNKVKTYLDGQIVTDSSACGSGAACAIKDHVAVLSTDLSATQYREEGTQSRIDALTAMLATVSHEETTAHLWSNGSSAFGTNRPAQSAYVRTNADNEVITETVTTEYRDRVTTKEPVATLNVGATTATKSKSRRS